MSALAIPSSIHLPVLGFLFMANCLALALFGLNRAASDDGDWGAPETRVLVLSLLGGWVGAKLGRMMYPPDDEPRSFGAMLNLSALAVPAVLALPFLLHLAPVWIGQGYNAYLAYYATSLDDATTADPASPIGASHAATADTVNDSTGISEAAKNATESVVAAQAGKVADVVSDAANTDAKAAVLPKRFGPGTEKKGAKKGGINFLSVGN